MKRVIVESPYAGNIALNELYARFCMHDCLVNHGESPYASHLLYTQEHVLDDSIPNERNLGIQAGFEWRSVTDLTVFYTDLGISSGMTWGAKDCGERGVETAKRKLPDDLWARFQHACGERGLPIPQR